MTCAGNFAVGWRPPVAVSAGRFRFHGRRRFKACEIAGKKPLFRDVSVVDPIAYVLSLNLHRRHLSQSLLAMVAARVKDVYAKQAKERQRESGKVHGRGKEKVPATLPEPIKGDARDQAGKAVGVSGRSPHSNACPIIQPLLPATG